MSARRRAVFSAPLVFDPLAPRPVGVPVSTFAEAAEALLASQCRFQAPQTVAQRRRSLALHVYPHLGHLPVIDVEPRHVVDVLEAVRCARPRRPSTAFASASLT